MYFFGYIKYVLFEASLRVPFYIILYHFLSSKPGQLRSGKIKLDICNFFVFYTFYYV